MIKVSYVNAFNDNYIWLIKKNNLPEIVIVDPGDARPVIEAIEQQSLRPVAILITHHHPDHVGGIRRLLERFPIPVYGPSNEAIRAITHPVKEGDQVNIDELECTFSVLDVPGHTRGHVAYFCDNKLFCGDTLFTGGCGRLFEGTPQQMYASLQKIAALPAETAVYCAHEYTLDNLAFAQVVEPENRELLERITTARATRQHGQPTVPSTLSLEKATNPFLRCHLPNVIQAAENYCLKSLQSGVDTFTIVRSWKDALD